MKEVAFGLVRHALTAVGTVLASKGFIEASEIELIAGAVVTILATAASVVSKLRAKKA